MQMGGGLNSREKKKKKKKESNENVCNKSWKN
jgi:hypothetical protein